MRKNKLAVNDASNTLLQPVKGGLVISHTRTHLKKRILVQDVGGAGFQTAGILQYVEDLETGTNTQIGPKDFFEMGSTDLADMMRYFG